MIERYDLSHTKITLDYDPPMAFKERAYLECGCSAYVGMRLDTRETCMVAKSCSSDHNALIKRFEQLLRDSLANPTTRLLVDVCDDYMTQAASDVLA